MNLTLLCGVNYWLNCGIGNPARVSLLCDYDAKIFSHLDNAKMFRSWEPNFKVVEVVHSPEEVSNGIDVVLLAKKSFSADEQILRGRFNGALVVPSHHAKDSWEDCVVREVAHHDFETGGLNEWDGAETKYSANVLQLNSATHSARYFPFWAFDKLPEKKIKAIDLGCGPVGHLRWGKIHGFFDLFLVDPLLPVYDLVLARHGLDQIEGAVDRAHRVACRGEMLSSHVASGSVDFLYTCNSLDHVQDLPKVMSEIEKVLKTGGMIAISCATREGTRQKWDQFHKTDIYISDRDVFFNLQGGRPNRLLPESMKVAKIISSNDDWLCFTAIKS